MRQRRVLSNPRPIRQDREAVERLVDRLLAKIAANGQGRLNERVNPTRDPIEIAQGWIALAPVRGELIRVRVFVTAAKGEVGFINGGGLGRYDGEPIVIIEANGKYPWSTLSKSSILRERLYSVLAHELSHAADVFYRRSSVATPRKASEGALREGDIPDLAAYYNHPGEVRAYMREIFESVRPDVREMMSHSLGRQWGLGGTVWRIVETDPTWEQVAPHLTPRNRARMLRGIVRAFEDEGL